MAVAAALGRIPPVTEKISTIVQTLLAKRSIARPVALDEDLRDIGISSLDMVNLMLSVEAEFDLTIPEAEMTPMNFRSVSSIDALVRVLTALN